MNERWLGVWSFWGDVHPDFADRKQDVESRVAAITRNNDAEELGQLALSDRYLREGYSGPRREHFDLEREAVRLGAFKALEGETQRAAGELRVASLAPAAEADLVCVKTPDLFKSLSPRDGLFRLDRDSWPEECRGNDPFFAFGDYAVYPHPFIRGYRELMGDLIGLGLDGELEVKVALDPARATSRADAASALLLDYWFGCRLTRSTLDSLAPEHLGETWHMRPVGREQFIDTLPLAATVFRWSAEGPIKTLEVDEVAPAESWAAQEGPFVVNRYLHALRDTRERRFVHVDGAVRAYDADLYQATDESPKGDRGPTRRYRKLFRVDGNIADHDWGRIVAHYFRGNELVIEYFGELVDERPGAEPLEAPPTVTVPAMVPRDD